MRHITTLLVIVTCSPYKHSLTTLASNMASFTASSSTGSVSSSKRRHYRVSCMIESSPFITTSRGSSTKVRKTYSRIKTDLDSLIDDIPQHSKPRKTYSKTDLDGLFDDIPQDGSPLPLQLIKDLNIQSPVGTFYTPTAATPSGVKAYTGDSLKDDSLCTNLMSLLAADTSVNDEPEEYHTPMVSKRLSIDTATFYSPKGSSKRVREEPQSNDITDPFENLTLNKRRRTVIFADELGDGSPLRTIAPPSIRFPHGIEFDDINVEPPCKRRKVDHSAPPVKTLRRSSVPTSSGIKRLRRSGRLSQAIAI